MICFVCTKDQPEDNGTWFRAYGNYGSTVFDPMDGSHLDLVVCDACLHERASRAECGREKKPVLCGTLQVGWARTPDRKGVPFNPAVMGSWDRSDVLQVDPEEVGTALPTVEWNPTAVDYMRQLLADREERA